MRFLLQGLVAMAILFYISVWVAASPTTESTKLNDASFAALDWMFDLQADR